MNTTHGAGATATAVQLGEYFSLQGCHTAILDLSGSEALSLASPKGPDVYVGLDNLLMLREKAEALVVDFGTPYEIAPKGEMFQLSFGYPAEHLKEIFICDIKLILGFTDPWNIGKTTFFLKNEQLQRLVDRSFVFLMSRNADRFKREFPDVNVMCRTDDYTEEIWKALREEDVE